MLRGMLQDNHVCHSSFQHGCFFVQYRSRHLDLIDSLHPIGMHKWHRNLECSQQQNDSENVQLKGAVSRGFCCFRSILC